MKYDPTDPEQFTPMLDPLNAIFGENVFQWWHTGGGCTAIQAFLEGDLTVMVTDNPHTDHGEEAYITPMPARISTGDGDASFGYAVGVYTDEGCELKAMDFCGTAEELPLLVTRLLIEAVKPR
jgi:hypothetical protein